MLLTIFTPIFNRVEYIDRLFLTLDKQEVKNFEWIIIDDGSVENIENKVKKNLQVKHDFPITFLKQKNSGKQRAINKAVSMAKGKYFFILDSDDLLFTYTTKKIENWCKDIESQRDYKKFAGVSGLGITPTKKLLGGTGNGKKVIDATNIQRGNYNLWGDMAEVYKTSILRKYPFFVFEGETFISEAVVWNKVAADGYKIRWHMEPIYIGEYLSDGLTRNSIKRDATNFKGLIYFTNQSLKLLPFKEKINVLIHYVDVCDYKKMSNEEISKYVDLKANEVRLVKLIKKAKKLKAIFKTYL